MKTSLQSLEERIRRIFGSVGDIGATWKPDLTPVAIAADLNQPGASDWQGRRFVLEFTSSGLAMPINQAITWQARTPLIIEGVDWILTSGAPISNAYHMLIVANSTSLALNPNTDIALAGWKEEPTDFKTAPGVIGQGLTAAQTFVPSSGNPITMSMAQEHHAQNLNAYVDRGQVFAIYASGGVIGRAIRGAVYGRIP